jgi:hypothetical protein
MAPGAVGGTLGLARLAANRVRADRSFLLALWLIVLAATTLVATAFQYREAVAIAGLQRAIDNAAPADRGISVQTTATVAQEPAFDRIVEGIIGNAFGSAATTNLAARSSSLAPLGMDSEQAALHLTVLGSYTDLEEHARLTAGNWPIAGRDPIEATLSDGAAIAMGLKVGDHLALIDASVPGSQGTALLTVVITGTWTTDSRDPYWFDDPLDLDGIVDQGTVAYRGPLMITSADLLTRGLIKHLTLTWRAGLVAAQITPAELPALVQAIPALAPSVADALPPLQPVNITLGAGPILDKTQQSLVLAEGGVTLLVVQFVVLAAFAVILVAALLDERRRRENRVLESRGATRLQIIAVTTSEAVLITVPAVVLAPLVAAALIHLLAIGGPLAAAQVSLPLTLSDQAVLGAALAGIVAAIALVGPTLSIGPRLTTLRLAVGREGTQVAFQRFGIDLALLVVAGVALWQLRIYGSPLSTSGGELGVDPLIVAGPAIGLAACCLVATRALPRIAGLGGAILVRRAGLVPQLGAHDLARRPLRAIRSTLLVMLAAGLTTFALVYDATWVRSQADQAAWQAASDIRVVTPANSKVPDPFLGPTYRAIPGVTAASPTIRAAFDVGGSIRSADLLGVDAEHMPAQTDLPGGPSGSLGIAIKALAGGRPALAALPLPGQPARIKVTVDAALSAAALDEFDVPTGQVLPGTDDVSVSALILDGDDAIWRFTSTSQANFTGAAQTLEIPLRSNAAQSGTTGIVNHMAPPFRLESIEVGLTPPDPMFSTGTFTTGTLDIGAVAVSDAVSGGSWTPVPFEPGATGWTWFRTDNEVQSRYFPPAGQPKRIEINPSDPVQVFTSNPPTVFRALATPANDIVARAIASSSFLAATGSQVGDGVNGTIAGNPIHLQIVGQTDAVPPLDPAKPFLLVDGPTVALADYFGSGAALVPNDWWWSVAPGASAAVDRQLATPSFSAATVFSRDQLVANLEGDPVALGVVGALLLGAISAMTFAALGFLVSASASIESRADEFGLLRALGLSDHQVMSWLAVEQGLLLAVGLVVGMALGIAFAWVVLPAVDFTPTGLRPIPEATLVVPTEVLAAMFVGGVGVLIATLVVARRTIARVSVASTLRAVVE